MANTSAIKRGWHWDEASSKLSVYVNGTEAAYFTTTGYNMGSSGSEISYTAGTPLFSLYATNAGTTSTNAEPFYVYSIMTGTGGYGGRARFHTYTNAALATNAMALKAYMEYGDSGSVTGLSAAFCAEIKTPNAALGGGNYYPLELEYVAGGTSTVSATLTGRVGWMYMNNTGDDDGDFDDNGCLMNINGLTVGTGHLFQANTAAAATHALRIMVNGVAYYVMLNDTAA